MTSRFFAIAALGTFVALTAVSAVGPVQPRLTRAAVAGRSVLHVSSGRSAAQRQDPSASKFDAALAGIARHARAVRPDHALADLHALSPAARFKQPQGAEPLVLIDAVTKGDASQLKSALVELGLKQPAVYSNDVGGWLPVAQLSAAAALGELHSIRAAMPKAHSGAVTSQGDFVQHSDLVRSANALTGAGVTVGVLSDSYDCYTQYAENGVAAGGFAGYANNGFTAAASADVASGDLPATVLVLKDADCLDYGAPVQTPFTDEGRAMLQIVHDVAPGASLAFYTAEVSEADFASGIGQLAASTASGGAGATVIADDVSYFDEPFFQDGLVAQAVDAVAANGVAYFSAAGNNGTSAYDNKAPTFATVSTSAPNSGEHLMNFDTSAATTTTSLPVTIPSLAPGEFVAIILEWDQPYFTGAAGSGGAKSQLDLCITGAVGDDDIDNEDLGEATCSGANSLGADPVQVMIVDNPANSTGNSTQETINIEVGLVSGTAPGRIKVVVEDDGAGSTINQFANNGGTLQGHPGATGAAAVGAAFFLNTPACDASSVTLDAYSSSGGDPILFDVTGARLATAVTRNKPDFVGPDGGNDTFLGFTLASQSIPDDSTVAGCANNASYPNFFGTSAATPHVAGIAALFLQSNPAFAPADLFAALRSTALAMGTTAPNFASGYGFVQADMAAGQLTPAAPAAPTLTLSASTLVVGASATLTWSSANTTGCTASGSWSGSENSAGSTTVTPTAAGTYVYSLTCANVTATSPAASATLTVTAAASSGGGGGGGGALDWQVLLGLAVLTWGSRSYATRRNSIRRV